MSLPVKRSRGVSATKTGQGRKTVLALPSRLSLLSMQPLSLARRTSVGGEDTDQPGQHRYSDSNTDNRAISDLPPNPSLQRTPPGRSPGRRR